MDFQRDFEGFIIHATYGHLFTSLCTVTWLVGGRPVGWGVEVQLARCPGHKRGNKAEATRETRDLLMPSRALSIGTLELSYRVQY